MGSTVKKNHFNLAPASYTFPIQPVYQILNNQDIGFGQKALGVAKSAADNVVDLATLGGLAVVWTGLYNKMGPIISSLSAAIDIIKSIEKKYTDIGDKVLESNDYFNFLVKISNIMESPLAEIVKISDVLKRNGSDNEDIMKMMDGFSTEYSNNKSEFAGKTQDEALVEVLIEASKKTGAEQVRYIEQYFGDNALNPVRHVLKELEEKDKAVLLADATDKDKAHTKLINQQNDAANQMELDNYDHLFELIDALFKKDKDGRTKIEILIQREFDEMQREQGTIQNVTPNELQNIVNASGLITTIENFVSGGMLSLVSKFTAYMKDFLKANPAANPAARPAINPDLTPAQPLSLYGNLDIDDFLSHKGGL